MLVDERFAGRVDDLAPRAPRPTLPLLAKGFFSTEEHLRELARGRRRRRAPHPPRPRRRDDGASDARRGPAIGLDTLVEAHDDGELERAVALGAP